MVAAVTVCGGVVGCFRAWFVSVAWRSLAFGFRSYPSGPTAHLRSFCGRGHVIIKTTSKAEEKRAVAAGVLFAFAPWLA